MKVFKCYRPGHAGKQHTVYRSIGDLIEAEVVESDWHEGDDLLIECDEMTEEAFKALPEHQGW